MNINHDGKKPPLTYKNLEAWRKSKELAIAIFQVTDRDPLRRNWGLCDQMQRAAVSVPSNIAEGEERGTNRDALRFLYISKGSLAELRTQLDIAEASTRIPRADYGQLEALADQVARLLSGMIKRRIDKERAERAVRQSA